MATALDQIKASLRLIGQLAEGEEPTPQAAQDALSALNQMLDSWSTERLAVFTTMDQVFNWTPDSDTKTLGPSGDFVGIRPILLDTATYYRDPETNVSFGIRFINQDQYNGIAVKNTTSTYPQVAYVNMGYPDVTVTVYPKPTRLLEWHFVSVQPLTQAATLQTELYLPPGYLRAFKYNLACEIAAEFGVEPAPTVQRIAMTSKRDVKRINNPDDVLAMPYNIVATRQRFNIYAGNY